MVEILKKSSITDVRKLAMKSLVSLSLRRDIQALLANDEYLNFFIGEAMRLHDLASVGAVFNLKPHNLF